MNWKEKIHIWLEKGAAATSADAHPDAAKGSIWIQISAYLVKNFQASPQRPPSAQAPSDVTMPAPDVPTATPSLTQTLVSDLRGYLQKHFQTLNGPQQ